MSLHGSPQIEVRPEGKARFLQLEHKFLNSHIGLMFEAISYLKLNNICKQAWTLAQVIDYGYDRRVHVIVYCFIFSVCVCVCVCVWFKFS